MNEGSSNRRVCYSISCIVWRGDDIVNRDADVSKYTAEMVFIERRVRYFNFASMNELDVAIFVFVWHQMKLFA